MLLRLVAHPPLPPVMFGVKLPDLPEQLPLPPNWVAQLQRLTDDDLDVPNDTYLLDKSTWIVALLDEVTFDLSSYTVTCSFIDGTIEEWPLLQYECIHVLENILSDVDQSGFENLHERGNTAPSPVLSPPPIKPSKHKKSRSLLMSIVASLVPSKSFSFSFKELASRPSSPSAPPEPTTLATPTTPSLSARALRRRARSNLVNAYRRFVASELSKRFKPGGYYTWIVESLLSRQQAQMNCLFEQAGGIIPEVAYNAPRMFGTRKPSFLLRQPSSFSYCDDEGDGQSITTDTDDSSVHTPTDTSMVPELGYYDRTDLPRTPSPPRFSSEDIELYTSLNRECLLLRQILLRMEVYHMNLASEERQLHSALEVKSRRRAWLNRQLRGGAPATCVGLATPFRSSPLALFEPVTSEDWIQDDVTDAFRSLSISTGDQDLSHLFPRIEEQGEDPVQVELESQLADLEMGLLKPVLDGVPQPLPQRMRRKSMRMPNQFELERDLPTDEIVPRPSELSPTSLLCQPFHPLPEPALKCKTFSAKREAIFDPEFTLSVDFSHSYGMREDVPLDQGWIPPPSVIVGY